MKIAFHIARMNWYRVLASAIQEALDRGHDVTCWHAAGVPGLGENQPDRRHVPGFGFRTPLIREYTGEDGLLSLVGAQDVDVVVDVFPPRLKDMRRWPPRASRPYWVLMDSPPTDSVFELNSEARLEACDMFALHTDFYTGLCIDMMTRDQTALFNYVACSANKIGSHWQEWVRERCTFRWNDAHTGYFSQRVVVTGNSGFDAFSKIDTARVRAAWGLPPDRRVVALLPCPFGAGHALWERAFVSSTRLHQLYWILRFGRPDLTLPLRRPVMDAEVLRGVRAFCDRNDAALVAKLRHSTSAGPVLRRVCDRIVGEDGYYPHTAMELYRIAELTLGYYSSGCLESIAMDTPYLNIDIPFFPESLYWSIIPALSYLDASEGVMPHRSSRDVAAGLRGVRLGDFRMHAARRAEYLERYVGLIDGHSSKRFLLAVESLVRHGEVTPAPFHEENAGVVA